MKQHRLISTWVGCGAIGALIVLAGTQAPPSEETASPPADDMAPEMQMKDLAGPKVPDRVAHTLVHYNAHGEFQRLETRPEIAAVELLDLVGARRSAASKVIETYRDSLRNLLVDQIDLLKEATDAQEAKNYAKAQELYHAMEDVFNPEHARDPLAPALAAVLTPEERADVATLVDDYWKAWVSWELRNRRNVTDAQRSATEARLASSLFQQQIGRAYQTSLRPYQAKLESICNVTAATDEQREALRVLIIGFIRETRLAPSPEQISALTQHIADTLDEGQRLKLMQFALSKM